MVVAHSFQREPQVRRVSAPLCGLHQVQLHEALPGQLVLPHVEILCNVAARALPNLFMCSFFAIRRGVMYFNAATFANGPGVLVTFLSAGPQLEEVVLLQTEQAVSVDVDHLKDVRQHLPVARLENYRSRSTEAGKTLEADK